MVGTIIIGIGIDNSIQITERVREEGTTPEGIQKAVENTGQSVVEATFTTMGGVFSGVLISFFSSQFIGLRNFFALIPLFWKTISMYKIPNSGGKSISRFTKVISIKLDDSKLDFQS